MQGQQTKGKTPLCLHEKEITGDLQVIEGIDDIKKKKKHKTKIFNYSWQIKSSWVTLARVTDH